MAASVIPSEVWDKMLELHRDLYLGAAAIKKILEKDYGIFVSRQAVWNRLDNERFN